MSALCGLILPLQRVTQDSDTGFSLGSFTDQKDSLTY
jgi:hypothetical protein